MCGWAPVGTHPASSADLPWVPTVKQTGAIYSGRDGKKIKILKFQDVTKIVVVLVLVTPSEHLELSLILKK